MTLAHAYESTDPELFTVVAGRPVLLGSRCAIDRESFYPRRWICPICRRPVEDVEFAGNGVLYAFTRVPEPVYGKTVARAEGFTVGQIDLDEGVRIQSIIQGDDRAWAIGQRMHAVLAPVEGTSAPAPLALYAFAPGDAAQYINRCVDTGEATVRDSAA
jgi:uncharacterized OB-fold protein